MSSKALSPVLQLSAKFTLVPAKELHIGEFERDRCHGTSPSLILCNISPAHQSDVIADTKMIYFEIELFTNAVREPAPVGSHKKAEAKLIPRCAAGLKIDIATGL